MNSTAKCTLKETIKRIDGAYAPSTIRAYRSNFEKFICFCEDTHQQSLPAKIASVTTYIRKLSERDIKSSSIRIAIAAISTIHKLNRLDDPTEDPDVKLELRRMHRKLGRESKQAHGINIDILKRMIAITDQSLIGIRDRALILTAYNGMCRRSELVDLRVEDIAYTQNNAIRIKLRRSKADQDGMGRWIHLDKKTKEAIDEWLKFSKIKNGKIFRGVSNVNLIKEDLSPCQINRIYKKLARRSNLAPKIIELISGHSFRVGAAQDLLTSGASLAKIMQLGRWTKTDTVMRYIENSIIE